MQCANNLKQIGLATHAYLESARRLPPGGVNPFRQTWYHAILPYIEQTALYTVWDPTQDYYNGNNDTIATTSVATMRCPSDTNVPFFRGNYACNAGNVGVSGSTSWDVTVLPSRSLGSNTISNGGQPFIISIENGKFQYVDIAQVSDGLSNTLAFAECLQGTQGTLATYHQDIRGGVFHAAFCWFTTWLAPNTTDPDVNPDSHYCCVSVSGAPCLSAEERRRTCAMAARSRHPGGVNACLLDGSIRFVADSIQWTTWQALGTTQGNEMVGDF